MQLTMRFGRKSSAKTKRKGARRFGLPRRPSRTKASDSICGQRPPWLQSVGLVHSYTGVYSSSVLKARDVRISLGHSLPGVHDANPDTLSLSRHLVIAGNFTFRAVKDPDAR